MRTIIRVFNGHFKFVLVINIAFRRDFQAETAGSIYSVDDALQRGVSHGFQGETVLICPFYNANILSHLFD